MVIRGNILEKGIKENEKLFEFISISQVYCFAILYGIWIQPGTIFIRNFCLVSGALLSSYVLYKRKVWLTNKKALPAWIIFGLFIWVTLHLLLFSKNYNLQLLEYLSIWKRAALGSIFALGLGLTLSQQKNKKYWIIIIVGLNIPVLVFIIKYLFFLKINIYGDNCYQMAVEFCNYLKLYYTKTTYLMFSIPALISALVNLKYARNFRIIFIINILIIIIILWIFYQKNIWNGLIYSLMFIIIFILQYYIRIINKFHRKALGIILLAITLLVPIYLVTNTEKYKIIISDVKTALLENEKDRSDYVNYNGDFPKNSYGFEVDGKIYSRLAWGIYGMQQIIKNPIGYGLIEGSFGAHIKEIYPDTQLSQSHSGWIDLALGIGLPGLLMIWIAALISLKQLIQIKKLWSYRMGYVMASLILIFITSELSQKVYFECLIFFIVFSCGLTLAAKSKNLSLENKV